ncbi:hypothetical protein GW17_00040242 [Ensete ventricosum]|nr:hypothetical protein GW17_00040242 [Ensete ventricosum]
MALECRGIEESFPEKLAASPWDEEVPLAGVPSEVLCASSKPKCSKKPSSKSITRKSVSLVPLKKGDSKSERTTADEAGPNGQPPSFTDLPATVVSEILQCLDAKDLGIISCVSTLFNSLASDHYGWKDFYCDRWGPPPGLNPPAGPGFPNQKSWRELFVEREFRSKSFMGRAGEQLKGIHTCLTLQVSL